MVTALDVTAQLEYFTKPFAQLLQGGTSHAGSISTRRMKPYILPREALQRDCSAGNKYLRIQVVNLPPSQTVLIFSRELQALKIKIN